MFKAVTKIILITLLSVLPFSVNAWTINQSYDSEPVGSICDGWGSTQSVISSDESASGSNSCKQSIIGGEFGFGKWGGIIKFPKNLNAGDELWVRVRNYFPVGFNYNAEPRLKFLRVRTWTESGENRGYDDWYINKKGSSEPFSFIYEGRQDLAWNHVGTAEDAIKLGVWETYEFYIKFDTKSVNEGGTGRMRAWKDGVLMEDMTDRVTLGVTTDYSDSLYIFTYWNGAAPQSQSSYIDDVVVTNERPLTTDALGNAYIGTGGFVAAPVDPIIPPPVVADPLVPNIATNLSAINQPGTTLHMVQWEWPTSYTDGSLIGPGEIAGGFLFADDQWIANLPATSAIKIIDRPTFGEFLEIEVETTDGTTATISARSDGATTVDSIPVVLPPVVPPIVPVPDPVPVPVTTVTIEPGGTINVQCN